MGHFVPYIKILKYDYFLTEFSVELNLHSDGKDSCLCTDRWMFMPCVSSSHLFIFNVQAHLLGDIYFEMR